MAAFQTTCLAGTTIRIDTGQAGTNTVDIEVAGIARQAQFVGPTFIDVQPLAADTLVGWNLGAVISCAATPVHNVAPPTTAVAAPADALPFTGGHEVAALQLGLPLLGLGLAACLVARWLRRRPYAQAVALPGGRYGVLSIKRGVTNSQAEKLDKRLIGWLRRRPAFFEDGESFLRSLPD